MNIALLFDRVEPRAENLIQGPDIRSSPFVDYVALSPTFRHKFSFFTVDEATTLAKSSADHVFFYPIGLFRYFHRSWLSCLSSKSPAALPLLKKAAQLRAIPGAYLLLDLSWETANQQQIDAIPRIAQALNFPLQNIVFFSSNPMTRLMSGLPVRHGYSVVGAWFFEFYTHEMHRNQFAEAQRLLATKKHDVFHMMSLPEKMFLSLNRRMRYHRILLGAYLQSRNYLQKGFFSFGGRDANQSDNDMRADVIDRAKSLARYTAVSTILEEGAINELLQNEPFELDVAFKSLPQDSPVFKQAALATNDQMVGYYRNSVFSIVTETDYGGTSSDFLLTEKVFKPILFGHPVVIMSGPGALAELEILQYKPFSPAIDHGYDKIYEPDLRFLATMKVIDAVIDSLTKDPVVYIRQMITTAEANQNNFISNTPSRLDSFLEAFMHDLHRFKHVGTQQGVKYNSQGELPSAAVFKGKEYRSLRASRSPWFDFDAGFYEFEPTARGRWCSTAGAITVWLEDGDWEIILFTHKMRPGQIPVFRRDGSAISCEVGEDDSRTTLLISLPNVRQFVTITCHPTSTFVPASGKQESSDWRVLSVWLYDDFLIRRIVGQVG